MSTSCCKHVCLSIPHLPTHPSFHPSIYPSFFLPFLPMFYLSLHPLIHSPTHMSRHLPYHPSIHPSTSISIHLFTHPSIYTSVPSVHTYILESYHVADSLPLSPQTSEEELSTSCPNHFLPTKSHSGRNMFEYSNSSYSYMWGLKGTVSYFCY